MADTKTKKVAKKSTHPKYNEMIAAALASLAEKGGSSRLAILKYISTKYKVSDNPNLVNSQLKLALKKGVAAGTLTQVKGTGASGSFKLSKKAAAPKAKTAAKKPAKKVVKPKSPKAAKKAKSPKKATPKKPKVKKSPKKVAKPKPKKVAAKKPAKKAAAAKPKAKKPAKKTAKK